MSASPAASRMAVGRGWSLLVLAQPVSNVPLINVWC